MFVNNSWLFRKSIFSCLCIWFANIWRLKEHKLRTKVVQVEICPWENYSASLTSVCLCKMGNMLPNSWDSWHHWVLGKFITSPHLLFSYFAYFVSKNWLVDVIYKTNMLDLRDFHKKCLKLFDKTCYWVSSRVILIAW